MRFRRKRRPSDDVRPVESDSESESGVAAAAPRRDADDDEPPPEVIEELLRAFSDDAVPPPVASTEPATVLMADPAADLVPEPTRRSARRSRREAEREAKQEAKRRARLAKEQARISKGLPPGPLPDGPPDALSEVSGVRIIESSSGPQVPATTPAVPGQPELGAPVSAAVSTLSAADIEVPAARTVIADDGLPDAVYLDENLSSTDAEAPATPSRATVFIDDKEPPAALVPIDVATSASRMEPRMRERRVAVRRAVGRKRLRVTAIIGGVAALVVATLAILGSSLFSIDRVDVEGAVYSQGDQLDRVVDQLRGANVLRVDTDAIERELEALPWVAQARVTTDFPDGATVEIRERVPVLGYLATDNRYRVLDGDGQVIAILDGHPIDYPELFVDAPAPDLEIGQPSPRGLRGAAALVRSLADDLVARTESVAVDADGTDLRLQLVGGIDVRFGAASELQDKLVRLRTVLADPNPERPIPTELIDVSTNDVVVK